MRYATANDIINRAAVEIGLNADADPVGSSQETYTQLLALLNSVGIELMNLHDWPTLRKQWEFTTSAGDTGVYSLPSDFDHMIDQTGWDRTNRVAIGGPLGAQDWAYLKGRDLISQSIYASFRLTENKLYLFPQPPPEGLKVSFEYIGRNWVKEQAQTEPNVEEVNTGSDVVMLDSLMVVKFLKLKYLQAKGLPSGDAAMEFETVFESRVGKSEGASILSASRNTRAFPYINPYYNTGDTGFGGV